MVLPLIVLGLAVSGASVTLVLDLFLKRPFVSATLASLLPPVALARLGSAYLGPGWSFAALPLSFAIALRPPMPSRPGAPSARLGGEDRESPPDLGLRT